jgi:hypothetical protein
MFKKLPDTATATVTVHINGKPFAAPVACSAAAAMLLAGENVTRVAPVSGSPRGPYCMMGVCFECLLEIDGVPNQQSCLIPVAAGMRIDRQGGKPQVIE